MAEQRVVVSRSADAGPEAKQLEDAVIRALVARSCDVLVVPPIYHLAPDDDAAAKLSEIDGSVSVLSWLHRRAARWVIHSLGCALEDSAFHSFKAYGTAEECAAAIAAERASPGAGGRSEEIVAGVEKRWYPVIDYSRCKQCRQCYDFCLFGVYRIEGRRIVVGRPGRCKPGCPACARVCPAGAIMFPEYAADAVIAGADEGTPPAGGGRPEQMPTNGDDGLSGASDDELDYLIDALDELDE
jgi:NAD-dependent dihydropyrimidine dehydrogenase PreA subunit